MKTFYFFILFLFYVPFGYSQNDSTFISSSSDSIITLKRGFYYSLEDMLANSPQSTDSFIIIRQTLYEDMKYSATDVYDDSIYTYGYEEPGKVRKKHDKSTPLWGFCSGKNIYIRGSLGYYVKVLYVGRYILYKDLTYEDERYITENIININNGRKFQLNESVMKTILKEDIDLYEQYLQERHRREKRFNYLKMYCEKHREEIKVNNNLGL